MKPEEERPSIRLLVVRMGAVLLALLVVYVLGAGPEVYFESCHRNQGGSIQPPSGYAIAHALYEPLYRVVGRTPLESPLASYRAWWVQRAYERYPPILMSSTPIRRLEVIRGESGNLEWREIPRVNAGE